MRHILALLVLATAGCQPGDPPDLIAVREEIRGVIRNYHDQLNRGDAEAAAALAAPDLSMVCGGDNPVYGREASLALLKTFTDLYREKDLIGRREARYGEIRIDVRGETTVATYSVTFLEPKGAFHEAYTQVFTRRGGSWLLLHEHRAPRSVR